MIVVIYFKYNIFTFTLTIAIKKQCIQLKPLLNTYTTEFLIDHVLVQILFIVIYYRKSTTNSLDLCVFVRERGRGVNISIAYVSQSWQLLGVESKKI